MKGNNLEKPTRPVKHMYAEVIPDPLVTSNEERDR